MVKAVFRSTRKKASKNLVSFEAGDPIVTEGESGETMYVVQNGVVEIFKLVDGQETSLALLEKGDFFGEMAVLEKLPRAASARAKQSATLLEIDAKQFDRMLRTRPEISVRIMRKFSRRLRETVQLLREAKGRATAAAEIAQTGIATAEGGEVPEVKTAGVARSDGIEFETVSETVAASPRLVHSESGTVYVLPRGKQLTIGRYDRVTGVSPHIDLTPIDPEGSSGYVHASLLLRGGGFELQEEIGSGSATHLNDEQLETGVRQAVSGGDRLQFGEVVLTFEAE